MTASVTQGFPGLRQMNQTRHSCYDIAVNKEDKDGEDKPKAGKRIGCWAAHKGLTVVCLPANAVGIAVGIAGMVATAFFVGGIVKPAIGLFKEKPQFTSGAEFCYKATGHSFKHLFLNLGELAGEGCRIIKFCFLRLEKGIDESTKVEKDEISWKTPFGIRALNTPTKERRFKFSEEKRSYGKILAHYGLSFINMPVNAIGAGVFGIASAATCSLFIGKSVLYATTGINITVPTYAEQMLASTAVCSANVFLDLGTDFLDNFVLMHKLAVTLGRIRLFTTVGEQILLIPEYIAR